MNGFRGNGFERHSKSWGSRNKPTNGFHVWPHAPQLAQENMKSLHKEADNCSVLQSVQETGKVGASQLQSFTNCLTPRPFCEAACKRMTAQPQALSGIFGKRAGRDGFLGEVGHMASVRR